FETQVFQANSSKVVTPDEKAAFNAIVKKRELLLDKNQEDGLNLLWIAPTPEALELAKQASVLCAKFNSNYEKGQTITRKDLHDIDASVAEIRDKMKHLPKWNQEQLQEAAS